MKTENPYSNLADYCFWRRAVSLKPSFNIDPIVRPTFSLSASDRIATAGSCFAQHISRELSRLGYNYYIAEQPPPGMSHEQARRQQYGAFSARYGNVYTVRQLLQLFERAFGLFAPATCVWRRSDGRFVDPFRPNLEPEGFASEEEVLELQREHLEFVRAMFERLDVLVFTLGLTEGWRARLDGAVYPFCPGAVDVPYVPTEYEFVNFGMQDVDSDLQLVIQKLRSVNEKCRILLTVSPVPLIATFEKRHVLVSTTYSKSVLRVAADNAARAIDGVDYFPSYEIITGNFSAGRYFEADMREVNKAGVAHVMRNFAAHYLDSTMTSVGKSPDISFDVLRADLRGDFEIVCDEEILERPPGNF